MAVRDIAALKVFLSISKDDPGREAYQARRGAPVPRQFVAVGTTGQAPGEFLSAGTENRRFWVVRVKLFDLDRLRADRDQLWAEAAVAEAHEAEQQTPRREPTTHDNSNDGTVNSNDQMNDRMMQLLRINAQMFEGTFRVLGKQNAELQQQVSDLLQKISELTTPDLSDAHIDRVALLLRSCCIVDERQTLWQAIARAVIRLGAVVTAKDPIAEPQEAA